MTRPSMSSIGVVAALIGFLCSAVSEGAAAPRRPQGASVTVGIVVDGPWPRNEEVLGLFRTEILELTRSEFTIEFPPEKTLVGDWSLPTVAGNLDRLLADPEVDVVLAMGILATDELAQRGPLPKPAIGPFALDPVIQGLPNRDGTSGVRNLSYLVIPGPFSRNLETFRSVWPFQRIVFLVGSTVGLHRPGMVERLEQAARDEGYEPSTVIVGSDVGAALAAISSDTEAVYVNPLMQLSSAGFDSLVAALIERGLPSFSVMGEREVERGILVSLNPDVVPRLSRRVALYLQRILLGEAPEDLITAFAAGERLSINLATAERIGKFPPWAILTEATVYGESTRRAEQDWTLLAAVRRAWAANRSLLAFDETVEVARQDVSLARSPLLPQLDASAAGVWIDRDRAEAGFGTVAERTLTGSLDLRQILFAERRWAGLDIQQDLLEATRADRDLLRLDVGRNAASAYYNVLRSKTVESIQRENVALSRANLELADVRLRVGFSGRSDVLRWESALASNRKAAIEASARRNVAEIEFNRVLHRPLEESFALDDSEVADPQALLGAYPYLVYFRDKLSFRKLREFLAGEADRWAPELKSLDARIAAVSRRYSAAKRAFYLPDVALEAGVDHRFAREGAGSDPAPDLFPIPDDTDWQIALGFTYPLFSGGERLAERRQASHQLLDLRLQREAVAEIVEQRVRSSLHLAGASYAGIEQARLAAVAAQGNLDLVTDSYSQGEVSVIDLLDAQNNYIVAQESETDSIFDFLIDLVEVQRAVGRYDVTLSPEEQRDFMDRLQADVAGP